MRPDRSVFACFFVCTLLEVNSQLDGAKFFFGTTRRPKPTSAVVEHEPGIPPGWTKAPTKKTRPIRWFVGDEVGPETDEVVVESQAINITKPLGNLGKPQDYPEGVEPPEASTFDKDKNLVEWVLGLFGGNKPSNPSTSKPPEVSNTPAMSVRCNPCSCGVSYKHTRIVGGVVTKVNAYPWVAYLTYNNRFYCGGSLINDLYVLTAGHCVSGFTKDRLSVTFLDHDRSTSSDTKVLTRRVQAILKHANYNVGGSYNNDIALLKLDDRLPFGELLRPVCLPKRGETFTGRTGWGATESHGQVSNKLREVSVPIISLNDCRKTGYDKQRITENMLCAGYPQGMKDSCQGDSGGPLHVVDGNIYSVAGIVSWGEGCALANYPGVYTRVNRYITWIESNTKGACYCK